MKRQAPADTEVHAPATQASLAPQSVAVVHRGRQRLPSPHTSVVAQSPSRSQLPVGSVQTRSWQVRGLPQSAVLRHETAASEVQAPARQTSPDAHSAGAAQLARQRLPTPHTWPAAQSSVRLQAPEGSAQRLSTQARGAGQSESALQAEVQRPPGPQIFPPVHSESTSHSGLGTSGRVMRQPEARSRPRPVSSARVVIVVVFIGQSPRRWCWRSSR